MSETVSSALAKAEDTPAKMIQRYAEDFRTVLPTHIKAETWIRVSTSALKRGKRVQLPQGGSCYELELAASNNPLALMAALMEAARLGLEPGTELYYLTPRKVKGRLEIQGIVGYQGYIELMYRAGATNAVIADVVRERDLWIWKPGQLDTQVLPRWEGPQVMPLHEIDWDLDDRGPLKRVYAYARMVNGATSRVVVLNRADIAQIRKKSDGQHSEYSPWNTNEPAMWLKSSVRQLRKWVPTSPEWLVQQIKALHEAGGTVQLQNSQGVPMDLSDSPEPVGNHVDGELVTDDEALWADAVAYENRQQGAS